MPRIEEMFAFISSDEDEEDEGLVAFSTPSGMMPMIGADMDRAESLMEQARQTARITGKKVRLVHFSVRTEIEVFDA